MLRRKLESKVAEQRKRIAEMELRLAEAKAYLEGLQDSLKLLPPEGSRASVATLREGSELAKAREILRKEGKALHVDELLKRLGKELNRNNKGALGGSLGSYVRKGVIFTKPAPNTFGLTEFETASAVEVPPDDFGTNAGAS
jgi:hypothetical protein